MSEGGVDTPQLLLEQPVASKDNEEVRTQNRRVEIAKQQRAHQLSNFEINQRLRQTGSPAWIRTTLTPASARA